MVRPKCKPKVGFCPDYKSFKPEGKNCSSEEIIQLTAEETESLRLKNILEMDQTEAAKKMGVSQSTFQRILASAYKKVSIAIVQGKVIVIGNK